MRPQGDIIKEARQSAQSLRQHITAGQAAKAIFDLIFFALA